MGARPLIRISNSPWAMGVTITGRRGVVNRTRRGPAAIVNPMVVNDL